MMMPNNERLPALVLKMKALRSTLTKAEQRVVDYIIENPEKVIYQSVADLAAKVGVSDVTAVRTCQHLGLQGYQDLKITLAQDIVTPLQSIHEEIKSSDTPAEIIDKVFQGALHTINFTHDVVKASDIEHAAEAIMNSARIFIIGLGNSHSVALDLQHKLLRLGLHVLTYTDTHLQAICASFLTKDDLLFAISYSGSSRDIVDTAKMAKETGVKVISLTNIGNSPLSKISDIQLHTASNESKYRIVAMNSRIAQMVIIDSIYTIIAAQTPQSVDGFRKLEKALKTKKY
jgi:DNA-binding MurR/RpiR family transcriptional regulator